VTPISIARNEATSSYRCQPRAKLVGSLLGRFCNSHKIPCRWATAPQLSLENQRCAITKDRLIPFLQLFVFRQCLFLRGVADQLKSPRSPIRIFFYADVAFDLGRAFCRLSAGTRRFIVLNLLRHAKPFFCCPTGNDTNVGSRFSWKLTTISVRTGRAIQIDGWRRELDPARFGLPGSEPAKLEEFCQHLHQRRARRSCRWQGPPGAYQ
jgi:hypothetical protein